MGHGGTRAQPAAGGLQVRHTCHGATVHTGNVFSATTRPLSGPVLRGRSVGCSGAVTATLLSMCCNGLPRNVLSNPPCKPPTPAPPPCLQVRLPAARPRAHGAAVVACVNPQMLPLLLPPPACPQVRMPTAGPRAHGAAVVLRLLRGVPVRHQPHTAGGLAGENTLTIPGSLTHACTALALRVVAGPELCMTSHPLLAISSSLWPRPLPHPSHCQPGAAAGHFDLPPSHLPTPSPPLTSCRLPSSSLRPATRTRCSCWPPRPCAAPSWCGG